MSACLNVCTVHFHETGVDWHPALCMYRGLFLVILFIFLLGINTYGWRSSGVNHVLIFELDPRNHLNHQQLLEVFLGTVVFCTVQNFEPSHRISEFLQNDAEFVSVR